MPPRTITALFAVALGSASLAACGASGGNGPSGASGAITVIATTTQVGDLARAVAGDRAEVRQILQPNSDPHDYEPRPSDVRAVSGAAVVLRSGGDLDGWLDGVLRNAGSDAHAITLIDAVRTRDQEGETDPHWWQDPRNASAAVGRIRAALIAADPDGRAEYAANADGYRATLGELDRRIAACMAEIPAAKRKLVTDHDSLGYYTDRYDIDLIGTVIPALSTQAQASAGEVARLVRTIRSAGVTTIFPESSGSPKLTRAIARDAGAKLGPALYADSLGADDTAGGTYVGSLKANTTALANGFTGGRGTCRL